MEIREVTVADMLRARDARVERQAQMLKKHGVPLISFTMNIAGPIKMDAWIERAFREGAQRINAVLKGRRVRVAEECETCGFTGGEWIWAVEADVHRLKEWMRLIEEQDALGRLFDIDVINMDGMKISRNSERKCLICGGPVRACARSRAHSADELFRRTHEIIEAYFREQQVRKIALTAEKSLLYEVATTPKPGLVDWENSGAHSDMDRFTFIDSACELREYFENCAAIGTENPDGDPAEVFERIRSAGQQAEENMFRATMGVNTHKGALFSLGLLSCAAGMGFAEKEDAAKLLSRAAKLAQASLKDFDSLTKENAATGGEVQYLAQGMTGVRGEAAKGFPSAAEIALPALQQALQNGKDINEAGLAALMALMANVSDSNVLRRGGERGQEIVRREAAVKPTQENLKKMDELFIRENLSPGGCADLLAVTYFLHLIQK